jgi:hypothetical protein
MRLVKLAALTLLATLLASPAMALVPRTVVAELSAATW